MSPNSAKPILELSRIDFSYKDSPSGGDTGLYKEFSYHLISSTTLGIMGASGCGKSTLARIVAGLTHPKAGEVRRGAEIRHPSDVVYVDQHPLNSVFPWQKVWQNIAYPLKKLNWEENRIHDRVERMLQVFKLTGLSNALPRQLSGGEMQRLAMARSCASSPRLLVLDEAFAALDSKTKKDVQQAVQKMATQENITVVMVTHNVADVLDMCTQCLVIGRRPVEIVSALSLGSTFPRDNHDTTYLEAEKTILDLVRDGII